MFCEDQETLNALNALSSVVDHKRPPLVLWLGAGASLGRLSPVERTRRHNARAVFRER